MTQGPEVSVVVPCHDEGSLLTEAVSSVLAQKLANASLLPAYEIVVVADRVSDHATSKALDHVRGLDDRIRVFDNSRTSGPGGARNTGIAQTRGEWIAFLDADDRWLPSSLARRWDALGQFPDVEWVGADFRIIDLEGSSEPGGFFATRPVPRRLLRRAFETSEPLRLEQPVTLLLDAMLCWTGTVMARRALLERLGGFDETLTRAQDNHLWLRLASQADYLFVPEVLAEYRQRPSTLSGRGHPPGYWYRLALERLLETPAFHPYRRALKRRLHRSLLQEIAFHRRHGHIAEGLACFVASLRHRRFSVSAWKTTVALVLGRR